MRTTLRIDDDVLEAARSLARSGGKPVGTVLSELARKALAPRPQTMRRAGFPTFDVADDASPITPEMVRRATEDE